MSDVRKSTGELAPAAPLLLCLTVSGCGVTTNVDVLGQVPTTEAVVAPEQIWIFEDRSSVAVDYIEIAAIHVSGQAAGDGAAGVEDVRGQLLEEASRLHADGVILEQLWDWRSDGLGEACEEVACFAAETRTARASGLAIRLLGQSSPFRDPFELPRQLADAETIVLVPTTGAPVSEEWGATTAVIDSALYVSLTDAGFTVTRMGEVSRDDVSASSVVVEPEVKAVFASFVSSGGRAKVDWHGITQVFGSGTVGEKLTGVVDGLAVAGCVVSVVTLAIFFAPEACAAAEDLPDFDEDDIRSTGQVGARSLRIRARNRLGATVFEGWGGLVADDPRCRSTRGGTRYNEVGECRRSSVSDPAVGATAVLAALRAVEAALPKPLDERNERPPNPAWSRRLNRSP